jgi:hypothetical protein
MALLYRMNTKDDEADLIQLWSEHSGWDQVDVETWAHRLLKPPFGEAFIALAVDTDTDQIVGQFAFIPSLLFVNGREVSALRPFAPIISKTWRFSSRSSNPLHHPVAAMYMHALKVLKARGDALIYMVPDPRWLRFFRMFPGLHSGSFPLWSLRLPLAAPLPLGDGYTVETLQTWDQRVNQLWTAASRLHGCSVVRDSRSLPWKIGSGDYIILSIERNGEMVGLVASHQKGDRQWLVCDLLAADAEDSLRATLSAVCNLAHSKSVTADPEKPICKVAVLVTPVMEPVIRSLGFVRDAYDFPLVVHILDRTIAKEDVTPTRWYVSAND